MKRTSRELKLPLKFPYIIYHYKFCHLVRANVRAYAHIRANETARAIDRTHK